MQTIKKAFLILQAFASKVEKKPLPGFDHINIAARSGIAGQAGARRT